MRDLQVEVRSIQVADDWTIIRADGDAALLRFCRTTINNVESRSCASQIRTACDFQIVIAPNDLRGVAKYWEPMTTNRN